LTTPADKKLLSRPPRLKPDGSGYADWYEFDRWVQKVHQLLGLGTGKSYNIPEQIRDSQISGLFTENGGNSFIDENQIALRNLLFDELDLEEKDKLSASELFFPQAENPTWENRIKFLEDHRAIEIGGIYSTVTAYTAATLAIALGYGTWEAWGSGKIPIGVDPTDADIDTAEKTTGEKTVTLDTTQIPEHTHTQNAHNHSETIINGIAGTGGTYGTPPTIQTDGNNGGSGLVTADTTATNQNTGGGLAHNNLPPVIAVYLWKRTG
jgi:hypothetical protein